MNPFSSHYARRSEPSKGTPPEESATQASLKIIRDYFPFFKRHKAFKDLLRSVGTAKLLLALDKCPMSLAEVTFFDLCHVIGENLQDPEIAMESLSFLEELEVELGFSTSLRRTAAKLRFKITGAYPLSDLARGGLSSSALSVLLDESLREGALRAIEVVLRSANGPDKRAMRAEGLASIREYYAAAAESLFLQEIDDVLENLFVFARLAEAFHLHLADVDVVRNPSTPGAGS